MKKTIRSLFSAVMFIAAAFHTQAQGTFTFIYDQQSATGPISPIGNGNVDGISIQRAPLTQSFIPSLPAIGFVQLEFEDVPNNGNNGATVCVRLWTGSPNINSATLLGSTAPVYMPDGFVNNHLGAAGVTNFYFPTPVALTPGQTYYLQPVVLSGDNPWDIIIFNDTYPDGQLYGSGSFFQPPTDIWFREGIVSAPEPSGLALLGLAGFLVFARKRCWRFLPIVLVACAATLQSARAQAPFSEAPKNGSNHSCVWSIQENEPTYGLTPFFGTYGTSPDWTISSSGPLQSYFPVYTGASGYDWVRLSEFSFGSSKLRWMSILTCNNLVDSVYQDCYDKQALPVNGQLHLLCGAKSYIFLVSNFGSQYSAALTGSAGVARKSIVDSWFYAGTKTQGIQPGGPHMPVDFRVIGWPNCFSDDLVNYQSPNSGNPADITFQDARVFDYP